MQLKMIGICVFVVAGAASTLGVQATLAAPAAMHPLLGARLSGMGEHGVVNLQSQATKGKLC